MRNRTHQKLSLRRETIRSLTNVDLQGVAGGISGNRCATSADFLCPTGPSGKCTGAGCPNTSDGCGSLATCGACVTSPSPSPPRNG